MAKTRSELRTDVVSIIGRTDKTTQINSALSVGLSELTKVHNFRNLSESSSVTWVASTAYFSLPSGTGWTVKQVRGMYFLDTNTKISLVEKTKDWVLRRYPDATQVGKPEVYYVEYNTGLVYLAPTPDYAYPAVMRYEKRVASGYFASDATVCPVEDLETALIAWTSGWVLQSIEKYAEASVWFTQAGMALTTAIVQDRTSGVTFGADTQVKSGGDWDWTPTSIAIDGDHDNFGTL